MTLKEENRCSDRAEHQDDWRLTLSGSRRIATMPTIAIHMKDYRVRNNRATPRLETAAPAIG